MVAYSSLLRNLEAGGSATKSTIKPRKIIREITPAITSSRAFFFPYTSSTMSVTRNDQGTIRNATDTENGPNGMILPPRTFMAIRKLTKSPVRTVRRSSFDNENIDGIVAQRGLVLTTFEQ